MSMVTPPVALAAYTAASIAECDIMSSSFAAFRFALVGFTLPFMFVFRPELLFLSADGSEVSFWSALAAAGVVVLGIIPLAAGIAGYLRGPLTMGPRAVLLVAAALAFYPGRDLGLGALTFSAVNLAGWAVLAVVVTGQLKMERSSP